MLLHYVWIMKMLLVCLNCVTFSMVWLFAADLYLIVSINISYYPWTWEEVVLRFKNNSCIDRNSVNNIYILGITVFFFFVISSKWQTFFISKCLRVEYCAIVVVVDATVGSKVHVQTLDSPRRFCDSELVSLRKESIISPPNVIWGHSQ